MRAGVSWIFEVQLKDGRDADWRALMADMIDGTNASEPGTIIYEWSADPGGTQWQIHEGFVDSAAAVAHSQAFVGKYAGRFFSCVTPTRMTVYGAPDAAVRASLASLHPQYMAGVAGFTR